MTRALTSAACFLAPVAASCYICCRRFLCKNLTRGRSGLEAILERVLNNQFLDRFGRSLEHEAASFTRGKNPIGVSTKGTMSGVTPTLAVRSSLSFLDSYQFQTLVEPLTPVLRLGDTPLLRPPRYATKMLAPTVNTLPQ